MKLALYLPINIFVHSYENASSGSSNEDSDDTNTAFYYNNSSRGRGSGSGRCKAIEQYDLHTGELMATFSSGKECSEATGKPLLVILY